MKLHHLLHLTLCLAAATWAHGADAPKFKKVLPETPPGFTLKTLKLLDDPTEPVNLYVYVPDADGLYPCILDIHGGGWKSRQIESDKPMMERLAQRGFVTALVSYRLSTQAPYPAALHDCKAALRALRAHAAEWKIDPERIGCMGGSAGGHLSGLVSMTTGLPEFEGDGPYPEQSSAVKAAIVMAATQDLQAAYMTHPSEGVVLFLGTPEEHPEHYRDASPITHVRKGVPPTIFIEGEKDTVKIGRAEMMDQLKKLKIDTGVHTLKNAPHPFWMSQPWLDETVQIADAFFKKHLGKPKPPAYTTEEAARAKGPDFDLQGEFIGEHEGKRWGVQIWAQGGGQFEAVGYQGGLPGDGWDRDRDNISRTPGRWDADLQKAVFVTENGKLRAEVSASQAEVFDENGTRLFEL
ncbi:MAG: alpha/beta hydrolase, partial [Verrucomicrobiales bacterium]|nr:alpha/beta hydrolase [Verrucomicrobiales bacterium]